MPYYRRGTMGEEVQRIQKRLKELKLYGGPVDGIFGGGTEIAVKTFQRQQDVTGDGIVGPQTWALLFPKKSKIPSPQISGKSLDMRCLALTGSIETNLPVPECFACLSGDFDNQGLSFGALQWNLGQGSLQPLLLEMDKLHPEDLKDIFEDHYEELRGVLQTDREEQLEWSKSLQDTRFRLAEPWQGMLKTLGRKPEFHEIQLRHASEIYRTALNWCAEYGLQTERAVALMYDIRVQNGSISKVVNYQILRDFRDLGGDEEEKRLAVIAERRAQASNPRWIQDVRARKLAIARGEGWVHGRYYHLETHYGIRLAPVLT